MFEQENLSQILDILGNKNRRRIIDLLRNKPCFVTEISERLSLNPKAVIEHLALMQKESVIDSYLDDKRHKYYYLVQDIHLSVHLEQREEQIASDKKENLPLADTITHLRQLLITRKELYEKMEDIERDIDSKLAELVESGSKVFSDNTESEIILALIYSPLTPIELSDACGRPIPEVTAALRTLSAKGYVSSESGRYSLKTLLAEKTAE
ncbi:MAG TPA: ArsR family transcriptional regulator [Methanocorpusculum sp.]|nr:ArsR family transcriptional regulator [Methanocorpusculum sp.]